MTLKVISYSKTYLFLVSFLLITTAVFSQKKAIPTAQTDFWKHVQFGGGFGLNIGNGITNISFSPSAIYNFNEYFSAGTGLQGTYTHSNRGFTTYTYGVNLIGLANPTPQIQLSAELEQLRVNSSYENATVATIKNGFWSTGLFVGGGYRTGNVTIGARYNLLFKNEDNIYTEAFMPFVRIYF